MAVFRVYKRRWPGRAKFVRFLHLSEGKPGDRVEMKLNYGEFAVPAPGLKDPPPSLPFYGQAGRATEFATPVEQVNTGTGRTSPSGPSEIPPESEDSTESLPR